MKYQTQKQVRQAKSSKPQQIRKVMKDLSNNPDFILYNFLKAMKG